MIRPFPVICSKINIMILIDCNCNFVAIRLAAWTLCAVAAGQSLFERNAHGAKVAVKNGTSEVVRQDPQVLSYYFHTEIGRTIHS